MNWIHYIPFVINISAVYIALGLLLSLQPPFYPSEAAKKGATPAQYGFVFGIANLSLFLFSPFFGKYGNQIGAKWCFIIGSIVQGLSGFAFAFLESLNSVVVFITLSYILRFLEGVGTAASWSTSLGILMQLFPNNISKVMSWTQAFFGLGYMLGPAIGAWLYDLGGFQLPFLIIGSISLTLSFLLYFTIPRCDSEETLQNQSNPDRILSFTNIISDVTIMLPFIDLFVALCGNGMLESMLEPHLKSIGSTTYHIGMSFLFFGLSYMIGSLAFGNILHYFRQPVVISLLGNLLFCVAFMFIGPSPFLPLAPSITLIQAMMTLAGLAYSILVVSSFTRAQIRVLELGYDDDIYTYIMISGVWMSVFALGNFVGPSFAGLMVTLLKGFASTTTIFLALYALMVLVNVIELLISFCKHVNRRLYVPLEE